MRRFIALIVGLAACTKSQSGQPDDATTRLINSIAPAATQIETMTPDTGDQRVMLVRSGNAVQVAAFGRARGYDVQPIRVLIVYDPATDRLRGFTVVESKETPGFADQIVTRKFADKYHDEKAPVKIDILTGATLTSNALTDAINQAIWSARRACAANMHCSTLRAADVDRKGIGGGSR